MLAVVLPSLLNGEPIDLAQVPHLSMAEFRNTVVEHTNSVTRLASLFGQAREDGGVRLYAVLTNGKEGTLTVLTTDVEGDEYPRSPPIARRPIGSSARWPSNGGSCRWATPGSSLSASIIPIAPATTPGARAVGDTILCSVTDFYRVEGPEVHEVAVGPIHAGVIEPGHFRFQCHGEQVFHLEISLGYQHRGVERAVIGGPNKRTLHYMETLAGDTSIGHTTAYCQAVEALAGCHPPLRAEALRGIALELERLANHTGDLGELADDVGFLPTASFCGRLRGDFLNSTALLCGNRFGRSLMRPGGVGMDINPAIVEQLTARLKPALKDVAGAAQLLWDSLSVQARFENTGTVSKETAEALGLVGMAQRACGIERDVRQDFASGIYRFAQIPVSTWPTGDVFARAYVRWLEIERSGGFVLDQLHILHPGGIRVPCGPLRPNTLVVSLVEGWRGKICHVAITNDEGKFARYKIVDPSFQNWIGLMMSLRNQQISDFPLCNKSFNLSYCGHESITSSFFLLPTAYCLLLMFQIIQERFSQGSRTIPYPAKPPTLPERFRGLPVIDSSKCPAGCHECVEACPTTAISQADGQLKLDMGRCLFCTDCIDACPEGAIQYTQEYRLASRTREGLVVDDGGFTKAAALDDKMRRLFGRSLQLRQVSAGGCNACEADVNVLNTIVFDLSRFGIKIVASPRHADGLLITGPVTQNMKLALRKCYDCVPTPKLVIAVGACAISGGPFIGHEEQTDGADKTVPVDLYIPGCPPHPMTILDGLLRLLGRLEGKDPADVPAQQVPK